MPGERQSRREVMERLALGVAGVAATSCAKETPLPEALQNAIDAERARHRGRGLSVAVVIDDQPLWAGVSGMSFGARPLASEDLFAIGSITKNMIAALTLTLAAEERLSLADPIRNWLKPIPKVDGGITVKQLLNHASGLYQYFENEEIWSEMHRDPARRWGGPDVLLYLKEPYFRPGEGFRYSNTNYTLIGMIIEKVTGGRISDELRKRFWQPLGIEQVFLYTEEEPAGPLAHVWGSWREGESERDLTNEPRMAHESIICPSGGLFMTAGALASWCHALFSGKVIGQAGLREMMHFVRTPEGQVPNTSGYGLGLQTFSGALVDGQLAYGHSGASIGTIAYMVYLPELRASVAAMTNSMNGRCISNMLREVISVLRRSLSSPRRR